jgi:pyridoxamine 5'-phosphate oxidase
LQPLTSGDFTTATEPFALFEAWLADAAKSEPNDPTAMTLATVDAQGLPNARIVLLKGLDAGGFVFYTNTGSAKGGELDAAGKAALVFHWKTLTRQVRVRGPVERVSDADADAYYATRPYGSRIGAWASLQSRPLDARATLKARVKEVEARHPESGAVPRPPHWTGYRVVPLAIEFWHDRPFRLHDRVVFARASRADPWSRTRLYP